MADQHDLAVLLAVEDLGLAVDLGDERAGRVELEEVPRRAPPPAPTSATPWAEKITGWSVSGISSSSSTKTAPLALRLVDHVAVVDDLVADIDRRAEALQRQLDDLDRPVDAGAEAARRAEQDASGGLVRVRRDDRAGLRT